MYATNNMIAEVAEAMAVRAWVTGEKDPDILADWAAEEYTFEFDRDTGEHIIPNWVSELAVDLLDKMQFNKLQRVMLVGPEYSEERYHEGEVVLPAGAVGTVTDIYPQGGAVMYFVDFGTVTLLVDVDNLTAA